MTWQQLFFSYQGRINRAKYWLAILIYLIIGAVAFGILFALVGSHSTSTLPLAIILTVVGYIILLASGLSVAVKRLHDRDKSGWWILIFYILPAVLNAIARGMAHGSGAGFGLVLSLVALAISIWAFVELGCLRGTVGPNQYGPDPLEGRA